MPLNLKRFYTSVLLIFTFSFFISAQTVAPPSAADVMRERVAKAKAYIVVKNYNAAIYELENIRRESPDPTVHSVINVLLMNSYLEQSDYKRAQDFLKELANPQKTNKQIAASSYFVVAGQVVKGARTQLERYKSLGLSVSDRNLPVEAAADVQKMRETLEVIVGQSKILGTDKKQSSDAMALLEEATSARSNLAKDDYDAKRWKNEIADAREMLANSRSVIVNASGEPMPETLNTNAVATNLSSAGNQNTTPEPQESAPVFQPVPNSPNNNLNQTPVRNNPSQPSDETPTVKTENKSVAPPKTNSETSENTNAPNRNRRIENANGEAAANQSNNETASANTTKNADAPKNNSPLAVGSLVDYATQKTNPVYPPTARTMRTTGVVRVELMVDENGHVAEVQKTSGPALLQRAATDAVKKWKFKPFVRDGEPVKATGFVNFNFSL